MNDQKEFAQLLAYLTGSKSEQELETAITTIGEEGLKKLATQYEQLKSAYNEVEQKKVMDEMKLTCEEYLTKKAKFGAKLNYIQALKNRCPEGTQLYKVGGRVECKKCGGSAKVKPTGKQRFQGGGEMDDSELAYSQRMAGARMADPRTRGTKENPILLPEVKNDYIPQTGWYDVGKRTIMELPGSYTITSESYIPMYGSKGYTYDFDTNEIGRMIISSPKFGNDTIYFTTPTDYIMGKDSFSPIGADKDQNKAKARFKEVETKVAKKNKKK
jgi:hypothetical protein